MNRLLRATLLGIEKELMEMIKKGADDDYPEIREVIKMIHELRVNSKLGAIDAFDAINKTSQFVVAVDNNESIKVFGTSADAFDIELAFGIIGRTKKNVNKEMLYKLFLRVMDGDFDD